jgi:hypothetical protein
VFLHVATNIIYLHFNFVLSRVIPSYFSMVKADGQYISFIFFNKYNHGHKNCVSMVHPTRSLEQEKVLYVAK